MMQEHEGNNIELPRWGAEQRDRKAGVIIAAVKCFALSDLGQSEWIDVGCESGLIAMHIAPHVKSMTGIDPEPWPYWKDNESQYVNLSYIQQSAKQLPLDDDSVDVVVCNQVYEHVKDPEL